MSCSINNNKINGSDEAENTTTGKNVSDNLLPSVNEYLDVSSMMDNIYYDCEKSSKLKLSNQNNTLLNLSSSTRCFSDKNLSYVEFKSPRAASTPVSDVSSSYHIKKLFKSSSENMYPLSAHQTKNLSNKSYNNMLNKENQERKQIDTIILNNSKPPSQSCIKKLSYAINTKPSFLTLPRSSFTNNGSDNKIENNVTANKSLSGELISLNGNNKKHSKQLRSLDQAIEPLHMKRSLNEKLCSLQRSRFTNYGLNKGMGNNVTVNKSLSDEVLSLNGNNEKHINEQLNLPEHFIDPPNKENSLNKKIYSSRINISNNSSMTYCLNYEKDNEINIQDCLNVSDSSELLKMELDLKTFSANIVPYMTELKHELLQLKNYFRYKPDKQINGKTKTVYDVFLNIHNIMISNINRCSVDRFYIKDHIHIPFIEIDLNTLNVLNDKIDYVNTILEPIKSTLLYKVSENDKTTVNNNLHRYINDTFEAPLVIADSVSNISYTSVNDSFGLIRDINKPITALPLVVNDFDCHKSTQNVSKNLSLVNCSLNCVGDVSNKQVLEVFTPSNDSVNSEHNTNTTIGTLNDHCHNMQLENNDEDFLKDYQVKRNQNRYWLRNHPKSTDYYHSPFTSKTVKNKSCLTKNKNNDVFVCQGRGQKKVLLQYKIHSVLNNTSDIIKIICPDKGNRSNQNTSNFDITNLKPIKNIKPCPCGIFASQVPSLWSNKLHRSIHQNLHKLKFKISTSIDATCKINDNGFFYDIIKISGDSINNKSVQLMLKNVQEFINLELDFPTKENYNSLNHSVFVAVIPNLSVIGYLEVEPLNNACIYQNNNQLSKNLVSVKFGVSKLWVMVKYRNNGVATKLLKQFCIEECLETTDIAFAYRGNNRISFIKKYFANNSVLIY